MYSKASAMTMVRKINVMRSGVFQNDMIDHISGVTAAIEHFLNQFEQILEKNHFDRLVFARIKLLEQFQDQLVRIPFDLLQIIIVSPDSFQVNSLPQFLRHFEQSIRG